jgi:hypothetical protein
VQTSGGNFGSLKNVCHGGNASGATDLGVTSTQIKVGVLTDEGFTKDPELVNAANVFTAWCNAAGGIDGRKLVPDIRDTQLLQVVQAVSGACGSDFSLVGGSAALDGLAVKTRLQCLLPDFDAQTVMTQNQNSGLQVYPITQGHSYAFYPGYYTWLTKQKYPDSAGHVGILSGQSVITQIDDQVAVETFKAVGATVSYNENFPVTGASDWTPYAESIKAKGVKGLVFYGTPQELAALGGLTAPVNLAQPDSPPNCFDIEQATVNGWQPASFGANHGPYRCGQQVVRLTGSFPEPLTLSSVGKSMSDLK